MLCRLHAGMSSEHEIELNTMDQRKPGPMPQLRLRADSPVDEFVEEEEA